MTLTAARREAAERETARFPLSPIRPGQYLRASPLTLRILAVNVLPLAILVGGLLYLGHYQDNLIQSHLDALKADARLISGMVAESGVISDSNQLYTLSPGRSRSVIRRWVDATQVRTRLYDSEGALVADSQRLVGINGTVIDVRELPPPDGFRTKLDRVIDRLSRQLDTWPGRATLPIYRGDDQAAAESANPDLEKALAGDVSGRVWLDGDGHLRLTASAPVQHFKLVLGSVLLTRDGRSIEEAIRSTRFDIFKVFAAALGITVLLSLYLAGAIGRPLRRLAQAAERLRLGTGGVEDIPDFTARHDEIGELSLALREMTAALRDRMDAIERFAADVAHELKNPLSSLSSAVETVGRVNDPEQQGRLLGIIHDDVKRLDRLISDISNASRLDAELSRAEAQPVDLETLLATLADIHRTTNENRQGREPTVDIQLEAPKGLIVRGIESRLAQVFQNLISNAVSFSPPEGVVRVAASRQGGIVTVLVDDDGPGIPPAKLEAIFGRFYSERPSGEQFGTHSGLGLSIAKQIVEALGGRIRAENRTDESGAVRGARFIVQLPST